MHKFIAIGDIHADWEVLWEALRASNCATHEGLPTTPVLTGLYQVVLIGDLVHPKNIEGYLKLTGLTDFDTKNPDHLKVAAEKQIEALEKIKAYHEAAPHAVHIILGNHDDAVIRPDYILGTSGGLVHVEFDPKKGGIALPEHLKTWMEYFPRELRAGGLQFTHVSPMPNHLYYDDLFYADHSSKRWFKETPEYVEMAGLAFGVYGHTQMDKGILISRRKDQTPLFAMIDALHAREYLELIYVPDDHPTVQAISVVPF